MVCRCQTPIEASSLPCFDQTGDHNHRADGSPPSVDKWWKDVHQTLTTVFAQSGILDRKPLLPTLLWMQELSRNGGEQHKHLWIWTWYKPTISGMPKKKISEMRYGLSLHICLPHILWKRLYYCHWQASYAPAVWWFNSSLGRLEETRQRNSPTHQPM